jgi:hypothetical protein
MTLHLTPARWKRKLQSLIGRFQYRICTIVKMVFVDRGESPKEMGFPVIRFFR